MSTRSPRWSGERSIALPEKITLASGEVFGPIEVAYETWGKLNKDKSNAVLVCHALTGNAHVADGGMLPDGRIDESGWWRRIVGPGKPIDTNKFFVICSNVLGGCNGTTGPSSQRFGAIHSATRPTSRVFEPAQDLYPLTGEDENLQDDIFGIDFPLVTVEDMVRVQHILIDNLGIDKLACVIGGSLGGMQSLTWAKLFPERLKTCVAIAATWHASAQNIAFNETGRRAILEDPRFRGGRYPQNDPPKSGLAIARMIGHITYLSDEAMTRKFGTELIDEKYSYRLARDFQVESYLDYQGNKFGNYFDANTYLYLTKALDYFALVPTLSDVKDAFAGTDIRFLFESFSSDWLFPTNQIFPFAEALLKAGHDVTFTELHSDAGHDSFLLKNEEQEQLLAAFFSTIEPTKSEVGK